MNKTPIQWTEYTWNPLLGCRRVSPGCGAPGAGSCYAERLIATRFSKDPKLPMYHDIARLTERGEPRFTGERRLIADRLDEPLRKRKGVKVFVCDMGDLFFEGHPFEDIAAVFGVMAAAQQHTFQVLTKRAKRMAEFFAWVADPATARGPLAEIHFQAQGHFYRDTGPDTQQCVRTIAHGGAWPLPNLWIGVSVEDQQRADERIPHLLRIPAAVRFLSVEPQIGPVDLRPWLGDRILCGDERCMARHDHGAGIHWLICGGESGPKARPFDLAWARSLRDQCRAAGVPHFLKQLGANPITNGDAWRDWSRDGAFVRLRDSHGGDESEWPTDLRGCRAFPVQP